MAGRFGSFFWYELRAADPAKAKAFYDAVVGWTIDDAGQGEVDYRLIAAPGGAVGGVLPISAAMRDHGVVPGWLGYLHVDDVDAEVAVVEAAGGTVPMPARDAGPGVGRMAIVTDPQGAPYYVMKPTPPEGVAGPTDAFSPELPGRCAWNELATSDDEAAIAFYGARYGWTTAGVMPMGPMGDYTFLQQGDTPIGAVMPRQGGPSAWCFYFRVPSVDEAVARIEAGGGKVIHGPNDVPGGQRVVQALDAEGGAFGLVSATGAQP